MTYKLPTQKEAAAYKKAAKVVLNRLGFSPATPIRPNPEGNAYTPRDYELQTLAGLLYCSIDDDWMACRFAEPERANQSLCMSNLGVDLTTNLNPFSGKWNWDVLADFEQAVRRIFP